MQLLRIARQNVALRSRELREPRAGESQGKRGEGRSPLRAIGQLARARRTVRGVWSRRGNEE